MKAKCNRIKEAYKLHHLKKSLKEIAIQVRFNNKYNKGRVWIPVYRLKKIIMSWVLLVKRLTVKLIIILLIIVNSVIL